jgi:hypothetical protein
MIATVADFLGQGIYTPAEAAFYAREHTATIERWLRGDARGAPVVEAQFDDERFVSFLDFVQALAIANIRRQYDVPLQTIRQAVDEARHRHGVEYPFAENHRVYLLDRWQGEEPGQHDERAQRERRYDLYIRRPDESMVQLTGRHRGNLTFKEIVQLYLKQLDFGPSGLAVQYRPFRYDGLEIVMNPKRRFGEPLTPSNYTAEALWDAVQTEGSIDAAAMACGVERREVELACSYLDYLRFPPKRD